MLRNLLIAVSLLYVANAQCGQNTVSILQKCYSDFVSFYGYTYTPGNMPVYWDLHQVRTKMLRDQGLTVQPKICDVATALFQCTDKVKFDAICIQELGANSSDATSWMTDRAVGNYQCTDGYKTLMADFDCIGKARDANAVALQNCTDTLDYQLTHSINICKDFNDFLACQPPYYDKACGHNAGVFMCGVNRAGIDANLDLCDKLGLLDKCAPYKY
ncbi:unnamed protein product, partial [Mesorhabditis spiculigera]